MISTVNEFLDNCRGGRMSETPIVNVEQGALQGKLVTSATGKCFYSFQGVPYAKPPLGSLRFRAPQPPEPWEGIRDATCEGNVSAQIDDEYAKEYVGDENCLFLNVYTPNIDGEFLPVMFYIHGGSFRTGSGSSTLYGCDHLVEKDVVVVTINYRCGPLGFLCLNTPEVPGNAGLKDMVQALRWVKANIHNFGGNSGNLTVFGNSAGGAAVSLLTASPLSKNYVNKCIIQSGTALNEWAFQKKPLEYARGLAKLLGCESENVDDVLDTLMTSPVKDIIEANYKFDTLEQLIEENILKFGPVIEKEFPGVDAFITESFLDILTSGRVCDIPTMIGSTTLEIVYERKDDDVQKFVPKVFNLERNSDESIKIAEQIKKMYFKGQDTGAASLTEYFQLLSDQIMNIDTHRYIQYLIQVNNKPIYFYKFDYVGELNINHKLKPSFGLRFAGHGDELGYLFNNDINKDVTPTAQDLKTRERMVRLWTNFAKSGNPTPEENYFITVTWLPVTKDIEYCLKLGNELTLETSPDKQKMEFWDDLYSKYFKIWEQPKQNDSNNPNKEPKVEPEIINVTEKVKETKLETELIKSHEERSVEETIQVSTYTVETVTNISTTTTGKDPDVENNVKSLITSLNGQKDHDAAVNGNMKIESTDCLDVTRKPRPSNEIKMVQQSNGVPKDLIRANDPPEDDLPKNIGVNKFVNFFESLGGKK